MLVAAMGDFSIQISASLVNRLANDGEKAKKKIARKTKQKSTREPSQSRTKVNEKQLHGESDARKGTAAPGLPVQPPFFTPVALPVPSQDTKLAEIQSVIQESERVLERLQKQEDTMVQEVTARAKDLRDKEFKLPYQKPMPCLAAYEACRECYKEHANDILKCGPLTRSYYDCARRVKQQVSSGGK